MKEIGMTKDGEYLVSVTENEWRAIGKLQRASEGFSQEWLGQTLVKSQDMEKVFISIIAWTGMKFRLNELRGAIEHIEELLTQEEA